MKDMAKLIGRGLRKLWDEDQGANMVEYMLILLLVSLPLLGIVIWYWHDLVIWVRGAWAKYVTGSSENDPSQITH